MTPPTAVAATLESPCSTGVRAGWRFRGPVEQHPSMLRRWDKAQGANHEVGAPQGVEELPTVTGHKGNPGPCGAETAISLHSCARVRCARPYRTGHGTRSTSPCGAEDER